MARIYFIPVVDMLKAASHHMNRCGYPIGAFQHPGIPPPAAKLPISWHRGERGRVLSPMRHRLCAPIELQMQEEVRGAVQISLHAGAKPAVVGHRAEAICSTR